MESKVDDAYEEIEYKIEMKIKNRQSFAVRVVRAAYDCLTTYLCTRAPAPPMIASTSFLLAMVVSPGVVIASAP